MKKIALLLLLAIILPAIGYTAPLSLTLGGGVTPATGSLGQASDLGYHGAIGIGFLPDPLNSSELELVVRATYQLFDSDLKEDISIATASLEIKLDRVLNREPNMYLIGGGGMARVEIGVVETSPFGTIGFGVESGHLIIETRLVRTSGKQITETTFYPVTIGYRF